MCLARGEKVLFMNSFMKRTFQLPCLGVGQLMASGQGRSIAPTLPHTLLLQLERHKDNIWSSAQGQEVLYDIVKQLTWTDTFLAMTLGCNQVTKCVWVSWQTWTKSLASAGRARQAAVILTASASPFTKCWKPTSGFIFCTEQIPVSVFQWWKLAFYELSSVRFLYVPHVSWTASDDQFDFHLSLIFWNVKTPGMPFFFTTFPRFIAFWARLWAQEVSCGAVFFET